MNQPRTVINIEDPVGKQVGRRKPPADPMRISDSSIQRAKEFMRAFPCRLYPRGVFRFNTQEEANQWKMTSQRKS